MSAGETSKTKDRPIGSDIVSRPKGMCTRISRGDGNTEAEKIVHSFGSLPDFCLLQILNRLDIDDICNVADVNHQFKRVSKMSFTGRRTTLELPNYVDAYSDKKQRRVLCKFGDSIKSMRWDESNRPWTNLNAISRFCAGTLDELDVRTDRLNCDDSLRPLFSSLKTLTIDCGYFTGDAGRLFSECHELKILRLKCIQWTGSAQISGVAQKYGKLEKLVIGERIVRTSALNETAKQYQVRTINLLLELNLHIKKLDMFDEYANRTMYAFASKMDRLEVLVLRHNRKRLSCCKNVTELAGLKSLKVLEFHGAGPDFVAAIEAMESVPIEQFKWVKCAEDLKFLDRIGKWKSLKSLALPGILLPLGGSLAELIEQLPLLHELELEFIDYNEPVRRIAKVLERFPKLDALAIHTVHPELFDQQFYDALLEVILRGRSTKSFKVSIYSYFYVTRLQMHRQLQVIFLECENDSLSHYVRFELGVRRIQRLVGSSDRWESFRSCIR